MKYPDLVISIMCMKLLTVKASGLLERRQRLPLQGANGDAWNDTGSEGGPTDEEVSSLCWQQVALSCTLGSEASLWQGPERATLTALKSDGKPINFQQRIACNVSVQASYNSRANEEKP